MEKGVDADSPRVWMLLGHKAGDNAQVRSLAAALGWPAQARRCAYRATELLSNRLLGPTLAGLDPAKSDALGPPWPDLLISSGRRNEPVARWIRQASGGSCKLVHLGRPWSAPTNFDLVITTPQYSLAPGENILQVALPLHSVSSEKLQSAASQWQKRLGDLPAPRTAVLVGGDSGSFLMTADRIRQIRAAAKSLAVASGGSLLLANSARTPDEASDELFAPLAIPHHSFRWGTAGDNPYLGYLALADQFIVTGDSVSMVAEACATAKPVYLFHPSAHPVSLGDAAPVLPDWQRPAWYGWRPVSHRLAMRWGPARMRRDVPALLQSLVDAGRAAWLGDAPPASPGTGSDDRALAVSRVRALLGR
ncbi:MAG: mitochondrial fission ELM1 family protein [Gammaproteobacteria bacterium]